MTTGFVFAERYLWHETGSWAERSEWMQPSTMPEGPEPKRRIVNLLSVTGLLDQLVRLTPRPATRSEIEAFHDPDYVRRIEELSATGGGDAGDLTPFRGSGFGIGCLAAGGVITAVDAVLDGTVDNVYALVRPPGHHAEPATGNGFCIFNNIGIAVHHARRRGVRRVAIVDWDVHHGNGTEAGFLTESEVLTISLHQDGWWPIGRGGLDVIGEAGGKGANLNIPLPPGSGWGAYVHAFDQIVEPALRRFEPDLVIVACGYDANFLDPLARMMLDSQAFRDMTTRLMGLAADLCGGRLVMVHEGGYSAEVVPFCALAVIETLSGMTTGVTDNFVKRNRASPGQELAAHQAEAIAAAQVNVAGVPRPRE